MIALTSFEILSRPATTEKHENHRLMCYPVSAGFLNLHVEWGKRNCFCGKITGCFELAEEFVNGKSP